MYIKYYALQFIEKWAVYGPDSHSFLMYTRKWQSIHLELFSIMPSQMEIKICQRKTSIFFEISLKKMVLYGMVSSVGVGKWHNNFEGYI